MDKVILGMSGGVDSSAAAILLQEQGYEVIGVTFLFTDNADATDAVKVCNKLNIEHHVIDYRNEFEKEIINDFINKYKSGVTPNPCIMCNKKVKLKLLYDQMIKYNASYIATGHYARIKNGNLYVSADLKKDQTYFLSETPKYILEKLLLPLEGMEKHTVREVAVSGNLENANKKDSSDVCFITDKFKEYLSSKIDNKHGDIINIETNEKIGTHNGLSLYTIGQRKGLNIGGTKERLFVVGKDIDKNILYVGMGDSNNYLVSTSCLIDNVNWISDLKPIKCSAKFRYHQVDNDVELEYLDNGNILVKYLQGVKSVTPGQACVFYLNDECLGGGIIKEVRKNNENLWYL